jgi:hypothetical protein
MIVTTRKERISLAFWWVVTGWITLYLFFGLVDTVIVIMG